MPRTIGLSKNVSQAGVDGWDEEPFPDLAKLIAKSEEPLKVINLDASEYEKVTNVPSSRTALGTRFSGSGTKMVMSALFVVKRRVLLAQAIEERVVLARIWNPGCRL